jgi:hypothetical protein
MNDFVNRIKRTRTDCNWRLGVFEASAPNGVNIFSCFVTREQYLPRTFVIFMLIFNIAIIEINENFCSSVLTAHGKFKDSFPLKNLKNGLTPASLRVEMSKILNFDAMLRVGTQ